ncbi:hypothetical protein PInf_003285 [Phytophthora infestans]|nr:hypothetical protein PInf_003285 [Phytophthora infestans]
MQSFTFNTSQKEATKVMQTTTSDTSVASSIPAAIATAPAPMTSQVVPVAPTSAAPAPSAPAQAPPVPPPAPVEGSHALKQAIAASPEHVAPPSMGSPVLPPVEGADLATKGKDAPVVDVVVVTEMMGMM